MSNLLDMENRDYFEIPQMGICCACAECHCSPCMCMEDDCCNPGNFIPKEYELLIEL
jgi:hypothetical protein